MNYADLLIVIRRAAEATNDNRLIVIGSNAITPWLQELGVEDTGYWPSVEVDLAPESADPDLVELIGEMSPFHDEHGIYAQPAFLKDQFIAPGDWRDRMREFPVPDSNVMILTPAPRDLVVSKIVRGDERDWDFAKLCVRHFGISVEELADGLRQAALAHPAYQPHVTKALELLPHRI